MGSTLYASLRLIGEVVLDWAFWFKVALASLKQRVL